MAGKINYYQESLTIIEKIKISHKRPRILMHVCCGPCSTSPLVFLTQYFDVTVYFNNSNIYPQFEFQRRLEELEHFLLDFERDYHHKVNIITPQYDNADYTQKFLAPLAKEKEGGKRCFVCYRARMEAAYNFAEREGFDFFTTVMTISRQKDSQVLNAIGAELEKSHSRTKYFFSDFKKAGGQELRDKMVNTYNLYHQLYCGCVYTYGEGEKRRKTLLAKQKEEAIKSSSNVVFELESDNK
ncbi:MAG TPA: epoxyqueuosine reductase QueH [Bacilli bacterium]|nr:epoxyqueuosine reductase QueH [Bacilli bacterium]